MKIELVLHGLEYGKTSAGAYLLVLKERMGNRRMPIVIGGPEAQAIAVVLENMTPQRPFTHDTFKVVMETFNLNLKEVVIYNLVDGIFYAKLICSDGITEHEIDSRSSDAIAMAVRFNCPIYVQNFILDKASMPIEPVEDELIEEAFDEVTPEGSLKSLTIDELESRLNTALEQEDYESASKYRDELNSRKG
jgi:bifunctional DNase/RNase